jgi:hypothetical protein
MFCIQVVTSGVLKGYVQGAGGTGDLKDMFRVQEAPITTLYIGLYVF